MSEILSSQAKKNEIELERKYGSTYRAAREIVMHDCGLSFTGTWKIHYANGADYLLQPHSPAWLIEPRDSKKGSYFRETNTISISDWTLAHTERWELYEVLIHELLHAKGYQHGTKMDCEVQRCLNILKKKYRGFPPLLQLFE